MVNSAAVHAIGVCFANGESAPIIMPKLWVGALWQLASEVAPMRLALHILLGNKF